MKLFRKIYLTLIALLALPVALMADDIKGVIKSSSNAPLAGYLIKSDDGAVVAITNKRGEFTIDAKVGETLKIYKESDLITSHVVKSESEDIMISATPYLQSITQVLYPTIDRERSSAAVDVITADKFENNSYVNSTHSVIGKLASVITTQSSGEIFSDDLTFTVRGKRSSNTNTPLILVDGFESSMSYLSDKEIESVSVLKDAVATAVYGMRGANGVILITTKRGRSGAANYKVGVEYGMLQHTNVPDMADATTYAAAVDQIRVNDGLAERYGADLIALQGSDPYLYPDINWHDQMLKEFSKTANAYAEVSGGTEKVRYYAMFDAQTYDGMFNESYINPDYSAQNDGSEINFRTNVSMDVTKSTTLNVRIGAKVHNSTDPQAGVSSLYSLFMSTPANRYVANNADGTYGGNNEFRTNPLAQLEAKGFSDFHYRSLNLNVEIQQDLSSFVEGLSLSGAASFGSYFTMTEAYTGTYSVAEYTGIDELGEASYTTYSTGTEVAYSSRTGTQDRYQNFRLGASYEKQNGDHSIIASLSSDINERVYLNNVVPYLQMSFIGAANYGYKDKYFVDLVASYDGSNAYAPGSKFGFFPAIGASWILSREDFLSSSDVVDFLKLRTSYGWVGNDSVGSFRRFGWVATYATSYTHRFTSTGGTSYTTIIENAQTNPDLTWEIDRKFNIGVDARLFGDLNLSLDLFHEINSGIVQDSSSFYSGILGYIPTYINYGRVRNSGFDFTAGYQKRFGDFTLTADFNAGFAKNSYLDYLEKENTVTPHYGNSINEVYGFNSLGLYSSAADVAAAGQNTMDTVQAGDIIYADTNGDGYINEYDKSAIGTTYPTTSFGLSLNLEYKGLYVAAHMDAQTGYGEYVSSYYTYAGLDNSYDNISNYVIENSWTPETANTATLPRQSTITNRSNSQYNTLYMMDGDFLRLRTAEVGYRWSADQLKSLNVAGIKLYLRGQNLFVLDHLVGSDVETGNSITMPRYVTVGVNLEF